MSFEELPYFITLKQLADVTGEREGSIMRGIREGRIPADKVNGRWRICRDVIFKNAKKGASNDREGRKWPIRDGCPRRRTGTRPGGAQG